MSEPITNINDIKIDDVITFTVYGLGIVPNVTNATVLGRTSGMLLRDDPAAATNHSNLYTKLPNAPTDPTPNDYRKYEYLVLRTTANTIIEIGVPWIVMDSLVRKTRLLAIVSIPDWDNDRLPLLHEALSVYGFLNVTVEVVVPV